MQEDFVRSMQSSFPAEPLGSLHDLNRRFLSLAATHGGALGSLKIPFASAAPIARLSHDARTAAADCPYALFDLRFDDPAYWCLRLADAWRVADEAPVAGEITAFTRLALFYAWHLASTPKLGARLWLGMAEATGQAFRSASLDRLSTLAVGEAANLSARWSTSSFYWRSLSSAAVRGDSRRLKRVQLFGLQLGAVRLLQ